MPEGQEHYQCVAVTIAVVLGCVDQPLDLVDGSSIPVFEAHHFWLGAA
jgi:hypothetical protein